MARRLIVAFALAWTGIWSGEAGAEIRTECEGAFCIRIDRTEARTVLTGINREAHAPISIAMRVRLRNMTIDGVGSAVLEPREVRQLAVLRPDGRGRWSFSYDYALLPGDYRAAHDPGARYALPFQGRARPVVQGCGGRFSHRGVADHAVDFGMPEGTPVTAARDGRVVSVRDESRAGGRSRRYLGQDNRVIVEHADGTMGIYAHLSFRSVVVVAGQQVRAGDLLARSGNTGLSTAPHLHFEVYSPRPDGGRRTWPAPFRHAGGTVVCPREGMRLRP